MVRRTVTVNTTTIDLKFVQIRCDNGEHLSYSDEQARRIFDACNAEGYFEIEEEFGYVSRGYVKRVGICIVGSERIQAIVEYKIGRELFENGRGAYLEELYEAEINPPEYEI